MFWFVFSADRYTGWIVIACCAKFELVSLVCGLRVVSMVGWGCCVYGVFIVRRL